MKTVNLNTGAVNEQGASGAASAEPTGLRPAPSRGAAPDGIAAQVVSLVDLYRNARTEKEELWKECWAAYLGTPAAVNATRASVQKFVGDVNNDWRHRINTGKAYEIVETVNGYLQGAFFPNRSWFELYPLQPGWGDVVKDVKRLIVSKLKESAFRSYFEMYTRQLLVTGFSVMAIPWEKRKEEVKRRKKETQRVKSAQGEEVALTSYPVDSKMETTYNNAKFEVLSCFDVFIDPLATDLRRANMIRVITKTKADVIKGIENGLYPLLDAKDVAAAKGVTSTTSASNKKSVSEWLGIKYEPTELIQLHEFWGDIVVNDVAHCDIVCTILGDKVARFESNPYWGGKPFIIGTCVPIADRPYGLGILEPVLGQIHQLNVITNQRLDALELAVDAMWTVVNDGVTDPEDVYTAPGKVIEVASHDSIRPLLKDTTFTVAYNEANLLEQYIDKVTGTGAYIGTQQGRSGERVTATEIQAVKDAGGNRLASIHGHIEQTQLLELLRKYARMLQQFTDSDEIIRTEKGDGTAEYVAVGAEELTAPFDVEVVGAGFVSDKQYELQKLTDYVGMVAQFPQFSQMVNWEALLKELTTRFGFDDEIIAAILTPAEQPVPQQEPTPAEQVLQDAQYTGGKPAAELMKGMMQAGGENAVAYRQLAAQAGADPTAAAAAGAAQDQANAMMMMQGM